MDFGGPATAIATFVVVLSLVLPFPNAQQLSNPAVAETNSSAETFVHPQFVGAFRWDGKYLEGPKAARLPDESVQSVGRSDRNRPIEVPPWMNLDPTERVIEDRVYSRKPMTARRSYSTLRDRIVRTVYGRELALHAPSHLTTDSRNRLVVCDTTLQAVHVLDGNDSFRIQGGGRGHRLQHPVAVAADSEDNIYVSDPVRRLILVYSPDGVFQRYLGLIHGEPLLDQPAGMAISRQHNLLYVVDARVNEVTIMTTNGLIIRHLGNWRDPSPTRFETPMQVAVGGSRMAVLDRGGARVQVFDLRGEAISEVKVRERWAEALTPRVGLALDRGGNIYLTNAVPEELLIYTEAGKLLYQLDHKHGPQEALASPEGVWVDPTDRLIISDTGHSRIEVFQLNKHN